MIFGTRQWKRGLLMQLMGSVVLEDKTEPDPDPALVDLPEEAVEDEEHD